MARNEPTGSAPTLADRYHIFRFPGRQTDRAIKFLGIDLAWALCCTAQEEMESWIASSHSS